jgi:hypothetical protein
MSFAMLKAVQNDFCPSGPDPAEVGRVYADLSDAMHAMAQPLTVLRSAVAASVMPGLKAKARRFYLDVSVEQVERTCAMFREVQEMLAAVQNAPECAPIDLLELFASVAESEKDHCRTSGVILEIAEVQPVLFLLGDKERTLRALSASVRIAVSLSGAGDVVALRAEPHCGEAVLIVRTDRPQRRSLTSPERLSVSLTEINVRSQKGKFELAEDPFCVSLTLPIPGEESQEKEESGARERTFQVH